MKGSKAKPADYICKFITKPCPEGFGHEVRFYNQIMGDSPIGNRLSKGNLPEFARKADTLEEAELLCEKWQNWLITDSHSIHTSTLALKGSLSRKRDKRGWIG